MRTHLLVVVLATAVVVAACDTSDEPEATATASPTTAATAGPSATPSSTPAATATPTPSPTQLPPRVATDAVDAVVEAWNVALSMPADATEPTPDAVTAIGQVTADESEARAYLLAQAARLTTAGTQARGDVTGAPLDDFTSTATTFTVTACLSVEATAPDGGEVVSDGTWGAYELGGTVVDGQVVVEDLANVGLTGPDPEATADDDPSRPAGDACVPPGQEAELLARVEGFTEAYAAYSLDTSDQQALATLQGFTTDDDLLFPFEDPLDIRGLMDRAYVATATRRSATVFHCQDPRLVASSTAPTLVWQTDWTRDDGDWIVVGSATYGQPERSLLVPYAWEYCSE